MKVHSLKSLRGNKCKLTPVLLTTNLIRDCLEQANLPAQKDIDVVFKRHNTEGIAFLTKTLPKLGKSFVQFLAGNSDRLCSANFRQRNKIPLFLSGLFSRVIDPDSGCLKNEPDVCAITDIYQICMLWYKLETDFDDSKIMAKFCTRYREIDRDLPEHFGSCGDVVRRILDWGNFFLSNIFAEINTVDITPKHGPGAVAEQKQQHQKFDFTTVFPSTERFYPIHEYGFFNKRHLLDEFINYTTLTKVNSPCAKVHFVPKDSRGPRIIAAEPMYLQFLQQGLGREMMSFIEHQPLLKGHINFSNQGINQALALTCQKDGNATLDMKDASDSVSRALVFELFGGTKLYGPLMALRSQKALLPDGTTVKLKKYASMGSALCFPVESLVFFTLCVAIQVCVLGLKQNVAIRQTFVYGDDIIVPQSTVDAIFEYLPKFGLKINFEKSCYRGRFFESCGVDAFDGINITPIKFKRIPNQFSDFSTGKKKRFDVKLTKNRKVDKNVSISTDGALLARYIDYSNSMFARGYYRTADLIKTFLDENFGKIPTRQSDPHKIGLIEKVLPGARVLADTIPAYYTRVILPIEQQGFEEVYNYYLQRKEYYFITLRGVTRECYPSPWKELFRHMTSGLGTRTWIYPEHDKLRVRVKRQYTSF